ncbi:MAG TPA: hypothetical protein VKR79_12415 [Gaiellaceae bacterium]|nr:hypothetical protein [Gaiellaceae bacterium]
MGRKVLVLVVATALLSTAGAALASGSSVKERFTPYGFSLRVPQTWLRVNWCWLGVNELPIAVLTSAQQPPICSQPVVGVPSSFPPAEALGANDMSVFVSLQAILAPPGTKGRWNARVDGRPAFTFHTVGDTYATEVTCPAGVQREYRYAGVRQPGNALIKIEALMCGPDLRGEAATFRRVLYSLRFTH